MRRIIAVAFSVVVTLVVGAILSSRTSAQITARPGNEIAVVNDFRLVHTQAKVFRYDSSTGSTSWFDESHGLKWTPIKDQFAPTQGAHGKYMVSEAQGNAGNLVRIDTKTGATWYMSAAAVKPYWMVAAQ